MLGTYVALAAMAIIAFGVPLGSRTMRRLSPWAEASPSGNGHAHTARDIGELVGAVKRAHEPE